MLARLADSKDRQEVVSFYEKICQDLKGQTYTPYWEMGVYPTYEELDQAIDSGRVCIGIAETEIVCAAVISQGEDPIYADHDWKYQVEDGRIGIIHLFAISVSHRGKGYSGEFLIFLLTRMRAMGLEVCHLDALADNLPAVRLYDRFGFETSGKTQVCYEDLGNVEVYLFEYDLKKISSYS